MPREITPENESAAAALVVRPVYLADLEFESGPLYVTNAPFDVTVGQTVYVGVGWYGGFSDVTEPGEIQAKQVTFFLNGIPISLTAIALGENYQGRPATVSILFLDEQNRQPWAPMTLFQGRMDTMSVTQEDTASIELIVETRWADWERARVLRFNNVTQQSEYPDDKFFEFIPQLVEKQIVWPDQKWFKENPL